MDFEVILSKFFDTVYTEVEFVKKSYEALKKFGFNDDNAIASVCVCRDEISQSMRSIIKHIWGEAFNLSSLAGMFFAGKTGLSAAMHHAPIVGGKEHYVYYAFPHIAIDTDGEIGVCQRRGRKEKSSACGALNALLKEISSNNPPIANDDPPHPPFTKGGLGGITEKGGKGGFEIDNDDIEMSLIRMRLMKEIPHGKVPDLLELTKIAQKVIRADLENALGKIVNTKKSNYALMTGIQIHAPDGNYIWPADSYAVVQGKRKRIKI